MNPTLTCPACGASDVQPGDRFCPHCGTFVQAVPPAPGSPVAPAMLPPTVVSPGSPPSINTATTVSSPVSTFPGPATGARRHSWVRWAGLALLLLVASAAISVGVYAVATGEIDPSHLAAIGSHATATTTTTATATPPASPTATPSPVGAAVIVPSPSPSPTAMPTATDQPTATPIPTNTPADTATPTEEPTDTPTATAIPTHTPHPRVQAPTNPGVQSLPNADRQGVRAAVIGSNAAWMAALQNADDENLESVKTGESLQQTLASVNALQQDGQHWVIQLYDLRIPWIHIFSATYAQAVVRKDEYRAIWDDNASSPSQEWSTPYINVEAVRRVNGRWLVATINTADAAIGNDNVDPAAQGDPTDVVRAFYDDITARAYASAYGLFSDDLKSGNPNEPGWAQQFNGEQNARATTATVVYRDAVTAVVMTQLDTTWASGSGALQRIHYFGSWQLRYEHGGWRLDDVLLTKAS